MSLQCNSFTNNKGDPVKMTMGRLILAALILDYLLSGLLPDRRKQITCKLQIKRF